MQIANKPIPKIREHYRKYIDIILQKLYLRLCWVGIIENKYRVIHPYYFDITIEYYGGIAITIVYYLFFCVGFSMTIIKLYRYDNNEILFQSQAKSFKHCLEMAIADNIDLSYLDASNQDLRDINMDDATIIHGNFRGADLRGANMSEGIFDFSDFSNAILHGACLNESRFIRAAFLLSRFGDTDCAGAIFKHSIFQGPNIFTLRFQDCSEFEQCLYIHHDQLAYPMSSPPIVIQGLDRFSVLLDTHIIYGQIMIAHTELFAHDYDDHDRKQAEQSLNDNQQSLLFRLPQNNAPSQKAVPNLLNLSEMRFKKIPPSSHVSKGETPNYPHLLLALALETGRFKNAYH